MMLQQLQCPTFKKVSISLGNLKVRLKDALILYNTNGLKRFNDVSVYIDTNIKLFSFPHFFYFDWLETVLIPK